MKRFLELFYSLLFRVVLALRYRIKVHGLEHLSAKTLNKPGGILFLANHPAEIDPCVLLKALWNPFRPHPVAVEYLFHMPVVGYFLTFTGGIPVPSFEGSSNSYKKRQIEKTFEEIASLLKKKENLLIYPAGGLKNSAEEVIGGASGVHRILQNTPEANVVLIRTTGLWGSSFSKALTGKTPNLATAFFNGFKVLLRNGIFFAPKREIVIECEPAPENFPWNANRMTLNRYLEDWYNKKGAEPLKLVSYSRWKELYPPILEKTSDELAELENVPEEIKNPIIDEISALTKRPSSEISLDQDLSTDLGLDSLDISQLVAMLKEQFGVNGLQSSDLTTVGSIVAFAARLKRSKIEDEDEVPPVDKWKVFPNRPSVFYPEGNSIPEVFFYTCKRMGKHLACADQLSGEISYRKLSISTLLIASAIAKLPGKYIGIMLPASAAANVSVIATMLAGKIPVMINWTLGPSNLKSILEQSGIEKTISSWNFLDRLDNVELNGLDEQFILLEEVRKGFSWVDKLKALWMAQKKPEKIVKAFKGPESPEEIAVILFTSGTESVPKGVPLSHRNLMVNQKGAFETVCLCDGDILLSALPPFHSFGFSVTGLLPLLAGLKTVYFPNPTDGRRMVRAIEKWGVTLLCLAPTFLKNLLRASSSKQLQSIRLIVSGAEKMSDEIYEKMQSLNPNTVVLEGYGITECSPILTLNLPDRISKGVGLPFPDVELKIVNPETYEELDFDLSGLVLASGPNVFNGYLDPSLSSPFVELEGKKWYVTGDLGSIDQDGHLTLSGRLKRFAKIGGEMISLTAIEETLLKKGESWGIDPDRPSLAVSAKEEAGKKTEIYLFTTFDVSLEEANRLLKQSGMSNLIRIRGVQKLPFIPLLGTGKIDYRKLASKLSEER